MRGKDYNNKKEYYNRNLEKILKNYITDKRYGKFAKVLEDIFQRRAYEYGFSESEIEIQVRNFVKNVRKVKFASQRNFEHKDTAACYKGKRILLNRDYFTSERNSGDMFFRNIYILCAIT